MPKTLNRAELIGSLGRDAETRAAGGSNVTNFSIATERNWKDKQSGEWKTETDWHNVVAWNLSEKLTPFLTKGVKVYVDGRMQTRKYTGKDGLERFATEVVGESIILCGSIAARAPNERESPSQGPGRQSNSGSPVDISDDDVPF